MDKILPEQAYNALRGLKAQAAAVNEQIAQGNNCRRAMSEAQQLMAASQPWTSLIVKRITSYKEGLSVEDIDDAWLEKTFA